MRHRGEAGLGHVEVGWGGSSRGGWVLSCKNGVVHVGVGWIM